MAGSSTKIEEAELTVEQRLTAAEETIANLKSDYKDLKSDYNRGIAAIVVGVILVAGFYALFGTGPEPKPSNHDATLADLMSKGVHCYDSAAERGAARQRAWQAIDNIQWEQDHPRQADYPLGSPGPAPVAVPSVWDTAPQGESWDATRCFKIS
jgi:hypothetical protein